MKNLLVKILKKNNINHSRFARDMGISRSYAIALLNGKKPVTDNIYKKLISLNYISGKDSDEVSDEYFKIKYGENEFELVKYFLELGKTFTFEPLNTSNNDGFCLNEKLETVEKDIIADAACSLLRRAIKNKTELFTNYPFTLEALDDALYAVYKKESTPLHEIFTISHLINISANLDKESILTYWKSLKWGNLRITTYISNTGRSSQVMPWYFVCEDTVLLISEDMTHGLIFVEKDTADYYKRNHIKNINLAQPAIKIIHDESELLTGHDFISLKYLNSINTYISPMNIIDYDILYRTTVDNPEPLKDALIRAYIKYYSYTDSQKKLFVYYTNDTLEDWIEKGLLYNVSKKYLHEFSVADRITALENVIKNGMYLLMKKDTADFYRGYNLNSTDKRVITHFVLTNPDHVDYEIYMGIDKNRYYGLDDFAEALFAYIEFGNRVYTREESDFIIKQLQELHK